jgi:hypothetical protein
MTALDRLVLSARSAGPEWNESRATSVLSRVRVEEGARVARRKKAIVGFSLVAAAALFCARPAAGGSDGLRDASSNGTIAASPEALGLGDAGLLTD